MAARVGIVVWNSLSEWTHSHRLVIGVVVVHWHPTLRSRIAAIVLLRHIWISLGWTSVVVLVASFVRAILSLFGAEWPWLVEIGSSTSLIVRPRVIGILVRSRVRELSLAAVVWRSSVILSWRTLPVIRRTALVIAAVTWIKLRGVVKVVSWSIIIVWRTLIHWRSLPPPIIWTRSLVLRVRGFPALVLVFFSGHLSGLVRLTGKKICWLASLISPVVRMIVLIWAHSRTWSRVVPVARLLERCLLVHIRFHFGLTEPTKGDSERVKTCLVATKNLHVR